MVDAPLFLWYNGYYKLEGGRRRSSALPLLTYSNYIVSLRGLEMIELSKFPTRQGSRRPLYFESLEDDDVDSLRTRGYEPRVLLALPRETEADHKDYLLALTQGMAEGTIPADRQRLQAAELDLRAHGMLNKDVTHTKSDVEREKEVEELIRDFDKKTGRHVLFQTTITDPKVVEKFLLEKSGLLRKEEGEGTKPKRMWRRKRKGSDEE